jgi:hypothetical protein
MTSANETLDKIKIMIGFISPFLAAYLTYIFAIKGKQKDNDINRKNELNNVLSHLLIVWNYLTKLDDLFKLKFDKAFVLPIPKDYISFVLLKSDILNDNSFKDLEDSIINLKKYDPISFYELEGLGRKLEFLKKNFIFPFIKSKSSQDVNQVISNKYLKLAIVEIEDYIKSISRKIDIDTYKRIKGNLLRRLDIESEKTKDELLQEFYEIIVKIDSTVSYEQFISDLSKPETQELIAKSFEFLKHIEIEKLMELVADNPNLTFEQITSEILASGIKT